MTRPMTRWPLLARVAAASLVTVALTACSGYDELPLPLRELGSLRVERVDRFVEGPGVVQIALDPPSDASGPFAVVGHPAFQSDAGRVIAWAYGPCRGGPTPSDGALRLCLAAQWATTSPVAIGLVVESRADARRFTLFGEEAQ